RKRTELPLSVDTYFPEVAEKALDGGVDIINDVSGKRGDGMAELIKKSGAGWIIMHNGEGGVESVKAFFREAADFCKAAGIKKEQLCFDMGIGFGKSYEENLELIANVKAYKQAGYPLLLGVSRKRVIGASSGENEPSKRIYGNISADTAAILGGVDIIRIHDVKNEIKGVRTAQEIKKWIR
nr:dihydropteroate synthase [Eubacterium sp.]